MAVLSSKVEALSQDYEGHNKSLKDVIQKQNSLENNFRSVSPMLKEKMKESEKYKNQFIISAFRQEEEPRQPGRERGVKQEVADFNGDSNPEVFLDLLYGWESSFLWHHMAEEQKVYFA